MKKKRILIPLILLVLLVLAFLLYTGIYYRADGEALAALASDESVRVEQTDYGWFFDGPSADTALIFYPGGKVEETAYARFLHRLASEGVDVFLLRAPFRLAFFVQNEAGELMSRYGYERWYLGGHSLGGAVAALYASGHGEGLDGLILCAAYPTRPLDAHLTEILLLGSEDGVVNRAKLEAGMQYLPADAVFCTIPGGNHAQFGSYGTQRGDGEARIAPEEQWAETAAVLAGLPDRAA